MSGDNNHSQIEEDGDLSPPRRTPLQRLESHFWRRIASGLLVLIPLLVTVLILRLIIVSVDDIFRGEGGFFNRFIEDTALDFPGVGVLFLVLVLYVVGLVVAGRAGKRIMDLQSTILSRVPVVRTIFGVAKQITDTLSSPMGHRFSRVVFLEWPRVGHMALGFVTGHCHSPVTDETLLVVYIPTVPNPTSGNLAFVSESQIIESGMTVEDAMKLVFSGGIVLPEALKVGSQVSLIEPPSP